MNNLKRLWKKKIVKIILIILLLIPVLLFSLSIYKVNVLHDFIIASKTSKATTYYEIREFRIKDDNYSQKQVKNQYYKNGDYYISSLEKNQETVQTDIYCQESSLKMIKNDIKTDEGTCNKFYEENNLDKLEDNFFFLEKKSNIKNYFDITYYSSGFKYTLNQEGEKNISKLLDKDIESVEEFFIIYRPLDEQLELHYIYIIDGAEYFGYVYYEPSRKLKPHGFD